MISESLKKKVGQMLMCGFPSTVVDEQAKALLKDLYVGNYIYFARNCESAEQTAALSRDLSDMVYDALGIAPIITIDQEGGNVSRLVEGSSLISGAAAVSAATPVLDEASLKRVETLGENLGKILRACGVNINNAPDMDVNIEPANPVIGSRSYGDDPERVAKVAIAMMHGMKKSGVGGAIKHFPGHGNVNSDSHLGIPVNDTDVSALRETEFKTFELAIAAGAEATMSAHVRYTNVDPSCPGTLSKKIQTELLRDTFGFKGLAMTDCMEMDAVRKCYPKGEAAVMAIEAGVDLLTISHTYEAASDYATAIYEALESGRLTEERIDASYERIMDYKKRMGLLEKQQIDPKKAVEELMDAGKQELCDTLALDSQTMLQGSFPFTLEEGLIVAAPPQRASTGAEDMKPLSLVDMMKAAAEGKGICITALELPVTGTEEEFAPYLKQLEEAIDIANGKEEKAKVLLGMFNGRFKPVYGKVLEFLAKKQADGKVECGIVLMGAPYDLTMVNDVFGEIAGEKCLPVAVSYEYNRLSVAGLIRALESGEFKGVCPFKRLK